MPQLISYSTGVHGAEGGGGAQGRAAGLPSRQRPAGRTGFQNAVIPDFRARCRNAGCRQLTAFIPQKVFVKSLCESHFPHKFVNLFHAEGGGGAQGGAAGLPSRQRSAGPTRFQSAVTADFRAQ